MIKLHLQPSASRVQIILLIETRELDGRVMWHVCGRAEGQGGVWWGKRWGRASLENLTYVGILKRIIGNRMEVGWTALPRDTNKWWALVNTVTILQGFIRCRGCTGFSRTLLHTVSTVSTRKYSLVLGKPTAYIFGWDLLQRHTSNRP